MLPWPCLDQEDIECVTRENNRRLHRKRFEWPELPRTIIKPDLILKLEECPTTGSDLPIYFDAAQRLAELQQTLVETCPMRFECWSGRREETTFAIHSDKIPPLRHVLMNRVMMPSLQDGEEEDEAMRLELDSIFRMAMSIPPARAQKAATLCKDIAKSVRMLRKRDRDECEITRDHANVLCALEELCERMLKNMPAVRDEMMPNPVTETRGSTYHQNLQYTLRHYNLPEIPDIQFIKPYPDGHYMIHGEQLLLKTPRPVTAPHLVSRSVSITKTWHVKALDVRPMQVPDTITWHCRDDPAPEILDAHMFDELINFFDRTEQNKINEDDARRDLETWLGNERVHRHCVKVIGVGALDGKDDDNLIFLNVKAGHRRGSPPTGIYIPLNAIKLGVFENSRATCYYVYPSHLFFTGVSGFDANANRHGITGFSRRGSDLQLALKESDYTWVSEPSLLAHAYPSYGFAFHVEMGARMFFSYVRSNCWVGLITAVQNIVYPRPKGVPMLGDEEGNAETSGPVYESRVGYDALMQATRYQWKTSIHQDVAELVTCPICSEMKQLFYGCRNGHNICGDCMVHLAVTRDTQGIARKNCPQCRDHVISGLPDATVSDIGAADCMRYLHMYLLSSTTSARFKEHIVG
ncbi:protein ORF54 [Cyprinid herpesvirus 1]|uniref:Protein ORF54 n=1 Tax=Cyprinid herpesvirus 1 TaxID=317858 RepID=K7PBC8_9VIRU|nr:protein ORF54 [Cyprinid herpesvirus 1]AFJ20354.1 protein ORF54 [Cyprinid herpesvirus 1]